MATDDVDLRIDVRGRICPYPALAVKKALRDMGRRRVLEVLIDYEPTVTTTLPGFCRRAGLRMEAAPDGERSWRVRIEKPRPATRQEDRECASLL